MTFESSMPIRAIALVPARRGSKGIPAKNLQLLGGQSLVERTIQVALRSTQIDGVLVTTDDPSVISICEELGVRALKRPDTLASDATPISDVIRHALPELASADVVCLLEPTSPLRRPEEVDAAIRLAWWNAGAVIASVHAAVEYPELIYEWNGDNILKPIWPGALTARRQDRARYVTLNGLIYAARTSTLERSTVLREHPIVPLEVEPERGVSIDEMSDLQRVRDWLHQHPTFFEDERFGEK